MFVCFSCVDWIGFYESHSRNREQIVVHVDRDDGELSVDVGNQAARSVGRLPFDQQTNGKTARSHQPHMADGRGAQFLRQIQRIAEKSAATAHNQTRSSE